MPHEQVQDAAKQRQGLRRRWLFLMPAVFVTYSLAYLDRANYGFGAAAGMAEALHINNSRSAFLGSLFFFGYFLFQIPGAAYAQRKSAMRLVFVALLSWGALAALTGVIREFWLLALDRFLLGVAQSAIFPAILILLTHWFTRAERSRANAVLMLGNPVTLLWMSAATGFLIHAVGWQMTFVLEGIPAILWAFIWILIVRDHPRQAQWMSKDSCGPLSSQMEMEQKSLPLVANFRATLRVPGVLLLCMQYFCWSAGIYGFVLWLPTMVGIGSARGIEMVGLLSAVPFLPAVVLMLVVAHISDRTLARKRYIGPFLLIAGVALFISSLTAGHSFWLAYAFSVVAGGAMFAPYGPFFSIVPEMLPRNVAGEVMALVNSCGALGGFAGTWLVGLLQALTGNSRAGYLLMSILLMLAGGIIFRLRTAKPASNP
ncbi:MAG: MFS transporter [Terracidiphilus sp.]